jgi:hypothetical protein
MQQKRLENLRFLPEPTPRSRNSYAFLKMNSDTLIIHVQLHTK